MFSRNWGYYAALGGIGLVLVALCYVAYREFLGCNRPYDPPRYATSEEYPALRSGPLSQTKVYPQSTYKVVRCEEPQGPKEYELCQQRNTARASEDAVCVARAQYYLAILGLLFIVGTFVANAIAGWGAKRAADVAERGLRALERPYLFLEVTHENFEGADANRVYFQFQFRNHGKIPAIPLALSREFGPAMPQQIRHFPTVDIPPLLVVEPGKLCLLQPMPLGYAFDMEAARAVQPPHFLWFYGLLLYQSPAGDRYETEFCWYYNPLVRQFRPSPAHLQHNRMT